MKKIVFPCILLLCCIFSIAQKKPLDHTVYDGWQSIGERLISNNGKYVAYTILPQEGDGVLVIQTADGKYKKEIPRGYSAAITEDNLYLVCKIKPLFKDTRDAKIKKKKPGDMPKDSLAIVILGQDSIIKRAGVKSYKLPEKAAGWVAYLYEKGFGVDKKDAAKPDSLSQLNSLSNIADSLIHIADSLRNKIEEAKNKGLLVLKPAKKDAKKPAPETIEEGTTLVLRNLLTGEEIKYPLVTDYLFSKYGNKLAVGSTKKNSDTLSKAHVLLVALPSKTVDTVMKGFNEAKSFAFDETGSQLAFVAERDSAAKALQKFYRLWYYKPGMDSAQLRGDRSTAGVGNGFTISENYALNFSKSGKRLFIGLAPIRPVKDTTIPDFEKAGLDVWNYKDDNLQPYQLKNLDRDLKKSYLAVLDLSKNNILQLGSDAFPNVETTMEGDGDIFYAASDSGKRVEVQWQGYTLKDVYAIDAVTGARKLIVKNLKGSIYPGYTGKYLLLYDDRQKSYSVYNSATSQLYKVAADIKTPLYDEENDSPDDPAPYGIAGWEKDDKHIYVYDRYDIWKVDPDGKEKSAAVNVPFARAAKMTWRYVRVNRDEKYIDPEKAHYFKIYSEIAKSSGYIKAMLSRIPEGVKEIADGGTFSFNSFIKADSADVYLYTKENYQSPPDMYVTSHAIDSVLNPSKPTTKGWHFHYPAGIQLSHINPQQSQYFWGTAELFTWKAYTGKETEGVLYKPENFDPKKKYPMIVYYYERNNNTLLQYQAPAPTPSRLNIPFFVSRGYVVFVPDIWYTTGHPGKSAYDYVMSGTRALIKLGFIDSTKMGLQGQSWGGYQTAYLITQTNLFAAAWAGAPVVNMFSAYGGIRWESGLNRQMQYEKSQSRIGATIWERPDLYIENSPLFHLQKVKTPLVIMSNDADGAVPWYQGIEFFTAMRRLNKPIWLLEYNGEAHNLVERRNRKDIQIREQEFFDWLLKGEKPPVWITDGVPATLKGIDEGLEIK
jgi:dipeptidyl aminopeptidase/acylaminoacyl peptidase